MRDVEKLAASDRHEWEALDNDIRNLPSGAVASKDEVDRFLEVDSFPAWSSRAFNVTTGENPDTRMALAYSFDAWFGGGVALHLDKRDPRALSVRIDLARNDDSATVTATTRAIVDDLGDFGDGRSEPHRLFAVESLVLLALRQSESGDEAALATCDRASSALAALGDPTWNRNQRRVRTAVLFRLRRFEEALAELEAAWKEPGYVGPRFRYRRYEDPLEDAVEQAARAAPWILEKDALQHWLPIAAELASKSGDHACITHYEKLQRRAG